MRHHPRLILRPIVIVTALFLVLGQVEGQLKRNVGLKKSDIWQQRRLIDAKTLSPSWNGRSPYSIESVAHLPLQRRVRGHHRPIPIRLYRNLGLHRGFNRQHQAPRFRGGNLGKIKALNRKHNDPKALKRKDDLKPRKRQDSDIRALKRQQNELKAFKREQNELNVFNRHNLRAFNQRHYGDLPLHRPILRRRPQLRLRGPSFRDRLRGYSGQYLARGFTAVPLRRQPGLMRMADVIGLSPGKQKDNREDRVESSNEVEDERGRVRRRKRRRKAKKKAAERQKRVEDDDNQNREELEKAFAFGPTNFFDNMQWGQTEEIVREEKPKRRKKAKKPRRPRHKGQETQREDLPNYYDGPVTPRPIPTPGPMDFPTPPVRRAEERPMPTHPPLPDPITHPPKHFLSSLHPTSLNELARDDTSSEDLFGPKATDFPSLISNALESNFESQKVAVKRRRKRSAQQRIRGGQGVLQYPFQPGQRLGLRPPSPPLVPSLATGAEQLSNPQLRASNPQLRTSNPPFADASGQKYTRRRIGGRRKRRRKNSNKRAKKAKLGGYETWDEGAEERLFFDHDDHFDEDDDDFWSDVETQFFSPPFKPPSSGLSGHQQQQRRRFNVWSQQQHPQSSQHSGPKPPNRLPDLPSYLRVGDAEGKKSDLLGSGNFDVVRGGTFLDHDTQHRLSKYKPKPSSKRNFLDNFRDFADIKKDHFNFNNY